MRVSLEPLDTGGGVGGAGGVSKGAPSGVVAGVDQPRPCDGLGVRA